VVSKLSKMPCNRKVLGSIPAMNSSVSSHLHCKLQEPKIGVAINLHALEKGIESSFAWFISTLGLIKLLLTLQQVIYLKKR